MRNGVLLVLAAAVAALAASPARAAGDGGTPDATATPAAAEAPAAAVMRGTWIATAGKRVFRGRWSAQVQPGAPNDAVGSWTLDGKDEQVLLQGTWAARKDDRRWNGVWSARVERSTTIYAGTWQANPATLLGKTFADMLRATADHRVAGTWRAGRARGNWWLASETAATAAPASAP